MKINIEGNTEGNGNGVRIGIGIGNGTTQRVRGSRTAFYLKIFIVISWIYLMTQLFNLSLSGVDLNRNDDIPEKFIYRAVSVFKNYTKMKKLVNNEISTSSSRLKVNVATVACGNLELASVMLKSLVLFSVGTQLHLIIFTDEETKQDLETYIQELENDAIEFGFHFTYEINLVWFPQDDEIKWRKMHLKCTNQRLFFPSLLPHIDSLIYLDTDIILMGNVSSIWEEFFNMDDKQLAAASQNTEYNHNVSIYDKLKGHPYFGPRGLNAGVMLMNLTRLRAINFESKIKDVYLNYRERITYADQDMLNIFFNGHPEYMYTLSCIFNLYWIHCPFIKMKGKDVCFQVQSFEPVCSCYDVATRGLYIIHGNYGYFLRGYRKSTIFPWIYSIFKEYRLGDSWEVLLTELLMDYETLDMQCYFSNFQLIRNALDYFKNLQLFQ